MESSFRPDSLGGTRSLYTVSVSIHRFIVAIMCLIATSLFATEAQESASANRVRPAPTRVVVSDAAGFKAIDGNDALQDYLNETLGVVMTGVEGERLAGKLVKIKNMGAVLFAPGGDIWIHLDSAERGVWERPGPTATPLLSSLVDVKDNAEFQNNALRGLAEIGDKAARDSLAQIAKQHKDPDVRARAKQLLEAPRATPRTP